MVLTVRWVAPVLGAERFGVWATFSSLVAMLSFLDLGVGNALINQIAHATANGNSSKITTVVMGGLGWLVTIGIIAALVLAGAGYLLPWRGLFKLSSPSIADEARAAALIFSFLFGLNIISGGLLKVLAGQQRSYESQLITLAGIIVSVPTTWIVARGDTRIGTLLFAGFGLQALVSLLAVLVILRARGILDFSVIAASMRKQRATVLSSGSLFLILQIGTMVGWGGDALLVASISGASDVASYAIAQRLFLFASQPVGVLNTTLWPAYADAFARADRRFLRDTFRRSFFLSLSIGTTLAVCLFLMGPFVVARWTMNAIPVPTILLGAFALWTSIEVGGTALGMYLNGVGIVRAQVLVVSIFCAIALPAKVWGLRHGGPAGLVLATSVSYVVTVVTLYGTVFRKAITEPIKII